MVDFNSLGLPGAARRETNPIAIFGELPAGDERISNLWTGQERALSEWYASKNQNDIVIELNTGAGKSLIGLLIAESSVREGRKVLYICPTIDLVEQIAREAAGIGLRYSTRTGGQWNNDLYRTDQAFGITTYDAILTSKTHFRGDRSPTTVIFDDAHVAESKIREQYSVHVEKNLGDSINPKFVRLVELIIESAPDNAWRSNFESVLRYSIQSDPRIAPLNFGSKFKNQLNEIFQSSTSSADDPNYFSIDHIFGKWDKCVVIFTHDSIDIVPPIPPVLTHPIFASRDIRRIYLSATLSQESDFARAFGRKIQQRIRPDVDAGDGERLVVMSRRFCSSNEDEESFVRRAIQGRKALFAVPSTVAAQRWAKYVTPSPRNTFTNDLNKFRSSTEGAFILVSRFDGIDLPHNQCRLMVVDKLPAGSSLLERFLFDRLGLRAEFSAKIATRITQLFGRINRGRRDYGIYIVASEDLKDWLSSHRNLALLPELLQKQILLGAFIQSNPDVNTAKNIIELIEQVLKRDEGWTTYYANFLRSQELNRGQAEFSLNREAKLRDLFLTQAAWFSRVWSGDYAASTQALEEVIAAMSSFDQKSAGVADLWLGMVKALGGDEEGATGHYESAQGRLLVEMPFTRAVASGFSEADILALDAFGAKQAKVFQGGLNAVNGRLVRIRNDTLPLSDWAKYSFRQLEEATRALGEHIGFDASRPDSELEVGPDVIWCDVINKQVLAIELKTEKETENNLTKDEVGQCLNHEQWVLVNYPEFKYLGLVVVTDAAGVSGKASPSESMHQCSSDRLSNFRAKFVDALDAVKVPIMRGDVAGLRVMAQDGVWNLEKISQMLAEHKLKTGA